MDADGGGYGHVWAGYEMRSVEFSRVDLGGRLKEEKEEGFFVFVPWIEDDGCLELCVYDIYFHQEGVEAVLESVGFTVEPFGICVP